MITKMLIREPSPTYPPATKIVYRPNERVRFSDLWIKERNWGIIKTIAVDKPRNSRRQKAAQRNQARLQNQGQLG
jgi:hypothetical protein